MKREQQPDPAHIGITWHEKAMLQIGKAGITEGLIKEAKRLLKTHKYIKVRVLRSSIGNISREKILDKLCNETGAQLAGTRGNTAVIYKLQK